MTSDRFTNTDERVAYLIDQLPEARRDYLSLLLSYWQVFDNISIPDALFQQIHSAATQPETITRSRRRVMEKHGAQKYLEDLRKEMDKED